MRWAMIPKLVLAAVALATGVVLQTSKTYPEISDLESLPSECDVLKKLFCKKANWMSENDQLKTWKIFVGDPNNNLEADDFIQELNMFLNKEQDAGDDDHSQEPWNSYPIQFLRIQKGIEKLYKQFITSTFKDAAENPSYYEENIPNISLMYLRNKHILKENDEAHYLYDTYVATTNPFDVVNARLSCLYKKNNPDPPYQDVSQTERAFNKQMIRESLDSNEINPMKDDFGQRSDGSDTGQKEIPDELIFNEKERSDIEKKLFSFWSRLQGLSHHGRQPPTRRYTFVYYGPDGEQDGPLSAETRASHLRPPGQPLRWG